MSTTFTYLLMILIYFGLFWRKWRFKNKLILRTLFYIYVCLVIDVTLLPINITAGFHLPGSSLFSYGNFLPFIDLIKNRPYAIREIVLNVIMLIPFGILYPLIYDKKPSNIIMMALLFSFSIESLQLFMSAFLASCRTFDITDIITNTFGGMIGIIISYLIKQIWSSFKA